MFEDLSKAVNAFKKSKNVGVFCKNLVSLDRTMSIITLAKLCEKEEKSFELICPGKITSKSKRYLEENSIQVVNEPKSKNYVVSIDYSSTSIDKVVCKRDDESNKLNFVITPGDDLFSFDNVDLISADSNFDILFSFGIKNMKEIDESFSEVFSNSKVISITKKESEVGDYKFLINGTKSYSEVIYEFLKSFSQDVSEDLLNMLLIGVVDKYKLFEKENSEGWILASNIVKYGGSLYKALLNVYSQKDLENFYLQKKVMEKVSVDEKNRIAFSQISKDDLESLGINKSNLDLKGRNIFNLCKDLDIVFVIYQIDDEKFKVVLESNDVNKYSAMDVASAFNGSGSENKVVFSNKGIPAKDFEKRFLETLKEVYNIDVSNYSSLFTV